MHKAVVTAATIANQLKASYFRVLRVLADTNINPSKKWMCVDDVVDALAEYREGIVDQQYSNRFVSRAFSTLKERGLVIQHGNVFECIESGRKLVEDVMGTRSDELMRYRVWYSPEKVAEAA